MDNNGEKRFIVGDIAVFLMAAISVVWPIMLIGVAILLLARYHRWAMVENEIYKEHILNQTLIQNIEANQNWLHWKRLLKEKRPK